MEPSIYFAVMRRRWLSILVCGVLGVAAAVAVLLATTPSYKASMTVFLSSSRGESVGELVQGSNYTQNLVQSYANVATTPVVLDPVIRELRLGTTAKDLAEDLRADVILNTVIIEISGSAPSAQQAADIVNAVGRQLGRTVSDLSPQGIRGAQPIKVTTLAPAGVPEDPVWPNRKVLLALGLGLGLALGMALGLLRDVVGSRVRGEEDLARVTDVPVVGSVSVNRGADVQHLGAHGPRADAFRRLGENLTFFAISGRPLVCAVAAPRTTPATALAVTNLAVAIAESGRRVVLVDADMGHPTIAKRMGLPTGRGLSRTLVEGTGVSEVLLSWDDGAVSVLPSGPIPPNPAALLASPAMASVLGELKVGFDVVLLHSPALLEGGDVAAFLQQVDFTALVAERRQVRRHQVGAALTRLDKAGGRVIGVVLAQVTGRVPRTARRATPVPAAPWWRTGQRTAHERGTGQIPLDPGAAGRARASVERGAEQEVRAPSTSPNVDLLPRDDDPDGTAGRGDRRAPGVEHPEPARSEARSAAGTGSRLDAPAVASVEAGAGTGNGTGSGSATWRPDGAGSGHWRDEAARLEAARAEAARIVAELSSHRAESSWAYGTGPEPTQPTQPTQPTGPTEPTAPATRPVAQPAGTAVPAAAGPARDGEPRTPAPRAGESALESALARLEAAARAADVTGSPAAPSPVTPSQSAPSPVTPSQSAPSPVTPSQSPAGSPSSAASASAMPLPVRSPGPVPPPAPAPVGQGSSTPATPGIPAPATPAPPAAPVTRSGNVLFTPQVRSDAAAGPAAAAGPGSTGSTGPAAVAGPGSTPGAASGSAAAPEGERPHRAPDGGPEDRDDDGRADQRQTPPGPIFRPFAPPVSEEPGDDAGADPAPDAANGTPAWVGGSGAGTGLRVPQE